MRKEIFATWEELDELHIEYNLEDGGMSGRYPSKHWYYDDEAGVDVYVSSSEES